MSNGESGTKCPFHEYYQGLSARPQLNTNFERNAIGQARIDAVKKYLAEQFDVCPPGRALAAQDGITYKSVPRGKVPPEVRYLKKDLGAFKASPTKGGLVYVLDENFDTLQAAHVSEVQMFMALATSAECLWNVRQSETHIAAKQERRVQEVDDPHIYIGPNTSKDGLFVFMMHPLYTPEHQRYAPYPCIVITRGNEISDVLMHEPKTVSRIMTNQFAALINASVTGTDRAALRSGITVEVDAKPTVMDDGLSHFCTTITIPENLVPTEVGEFLLTVASQQKRPFAYPPNEKIVARLLKDALKDTPTD